MNNTIYIAGLGAVCALGSDVTKVKDSLYKSCQNYKLKPSVFETQINSPVFESNVEDINKFPSRTLAFALSASKEAINNASISSTCMKSMRIGVCVGTTVGCMFQSIEYYKDYKNKITPDPKIVKKYLKSDPALFLKKHFKFTGPAMTVTTACASGANSIGIGKEWINAGICDIVLAGGSDELDLIPYTGFNSLMLLSKDLCRPFDRDRSGLNLGEGAGFVVLESQDSIQKRKIESELFVAGYGTNADGFHLTGPHPEGLYLSKSIHTALRKACIEPEKIGYVNAHGTSTIENDKIEGNLLKNIFGEKLKFGSTKCYTGHTLGAAGGLEAVFSCLGLKSGIFPVNAGFNNPDSNINLSPLINNTSIKTNYVLSTSLGFGGVNAALIFGKKS